MSVAALPRIGQREVKIASEPVSWPDAVDDLLGGDLVVVVGSPTPGGGVALYCVAPIGMRDREAGTVAFTSPLGFGRKLERIAEDPRVGIAYHTRQYGRSDRCGYALVHGTAQARRIDSRQWLREQAAIYDDGLLPGRLWDRWLRLYYEDRAVVTVRVQRILWWPGEPGSEPPAILGAQLPRAESPSQAAPTDAETARVRTWSVARRMQGGHRLVAVQQSDGMPLILPFEVQSVGRDALTLAVASPLLPSGQRRGGILVHDFHPRLVGLSVATHTGWLQADPTPRWTPHTRHTLYAPPNRLAVIVASGAVTRWRGWH